MRFDTKHTDVEGTCSELKKLDDDLKKCEVIPIRDGKAEINDTMQMCSENGKAILKKLPNSKCYTNSIAQWKEISKGKWSKCRQDGVRPYPCDLVLACIEAVYSTPCGPDYGAFMKLAYTHIVRYKKADGKCAGSS